MLLKDYFPDLQIDHAVLKDGTKVEGDQIVVYAHVDNEGNETIYEEDYGKENGNSGNNPQI